MKTLLLTILCALIIINQGFPQKRQEKWEPIRISPTPHDPNFKSRLKSTVSKSFYKSKDKWQTIIDSTWGPGLPLNEKLNIFNTYTQRLTEKFDGFHSLGINETEWDSTVSAYRSRITDSTSRGAFAALMNHLASDLMDVHTYAGDNVVYYTPLNPGIPQLMIHSGDQSHFGAVLTVAEDSMILVLRSLDNHPLGLKPGDIILGYEGIGWNALVNELFKAGIPLYSDQRGAESASRHIELMSAGLNWHLFDTIDIIKYASRDTVHLPTYPLLDLPVPTGDIWTGGTNLILCNEQLPVPGVPFPDADLLQERGVTYGIVDGSNMGYIYLYNEAYAGFGWFSYYTDPQFYEAVSSLMETEGLIIDLRLNYGGWAYYKNAEALLFNQQLYTLQGANRCNTSDFSLCSVQNYADFEITGHPNSLYDKPIAVLIGPNCCSHGDITSYILDYHPMTHFFGKPTCGSLSLSEGITDFPGWDINYSIRDMFQINNPGIYLNRREFPVDVPVWFNTDDVAAGIDPVVQAAMEWMQNLSYAHDVSVEQSYVVPGTGTAAITAQLENPQSHSLSVKAYIKDLNDLMIDSIAFFDDGNHNDIDPEDGIWGASWIPSGEETYTVSVSTKDSETGSLRTLPNVVRFTTIGPVEYDSYTFGSFDTICNPGDELAMLLRLKNNSATNSAININAKLMSLDTLVTLKSTSERSFGDIAPGENAVSTDYYRFNVSDKCPINTLLHFAIDITSDGFLFWSDTFSITVQPPVVGIEEIREPITRIYPNPSENIINIEIENAGQQDLKIEIYTITGQLIYQKEYESIRVQFVEQIDLSGYAKGIYLIKVMQSNAMYVGKMIVR